MDEKDLTKTINGEDHTLGNLLRHHLLKNPQTVFAAYKVPHPLFHTVSVRVLTLDEPADAVFNLAVQSALKELNTFEKAFDEAVKR